MGNSWSALIEAADVRVPPNTACMPAIASHTRALNLFMRRSESVRDCALSKEKCQTPTRNPPGWAGRSATRQVRTLNTYPSPVGPRKGRQKALQVKTPLKGALAQAKKNARETESR